jgi:CDP-glucose 4,6-dehydratase
MQGHIVSGISLDPEKESLFNQAKLQKIFQHDIRLDIRNRALLKQKILKIQPEVVIHLAAQSLVRQSYREPLETYEINLMGTLNILEATQNIEALKAILIVTTDKVYKNYEHLRGYVESDQLGGIDPYSSSKSVADLAAQSWIKCFGKVPIAIARAGNVIGGGDWAVDRLIPDLVSAYKRGSVPNLRYPNAIRPWQHVLDCLNGYLLLLQKQVKVGAGGEWNFGPKLPEKHSVAELTESFALAWGAIGKPWQSDKNEHLEEAGYLLLDSTKARKELNWSEKLNFHLTVTWTSDWYRQASLINPRAVTEQQIEDFLRI